MKTTMNPACVPMPSCQNKSNAVPANNHFSQISAQAQQADISITTREGDRITISSNFYHQQSLEKSWAGNSADKIIASQIEKSGFSFMVQGDLNETELADLASLLDDLTQIGADFFNGNLEGAVMGALNLSDMGDSLSELRASFTRTSIFSTKLNGPHPVFASAPSLIEDFKNQEEELDLNNRAAEMIEAQWQQFIDYLYDDNPPSRHETAPRETDQQGPAPEQTMFAKAREILTPHPRLAPHLPSMAELALRNVAGMFEDSPENNSILNRARENFMDEYLNWLT